MKETTGRLGFPDQVRKGVIKQKSRIGINQETAIFLSLIPRIVSNFSKWPVFSLRVDSEFF